MLTAWHHNLRTLTLSLNILLMLCMVECALVIFVGNKDTELNHICKTKVDLKVRTKTVLHIDSAPGKLFMLYNLRVTKPG